MQTKLLTVCCLSFVRVEQLHQKDVRVHKFTEAKFQSIHCFHRGDRKGRVPRYVPPADISSGLGSRLQRGCSGDNAGQERQKPFHSTSLSDAQQASAQSNGSVRPCWRQAGGTQHR